VSKSGHARAGSVPAVSLTAGTSHLKVTTVTAQVFFIFEGDNKFHGGDMKTRSFHLINLRGLLVFARTILFLLAGIFSSVPKGAYAQGALRVGVKTKVPLTQAVVDQLAQYGQVGNPMWKINIVDMRVREDNLAQLKAHSLVEYVKQEQTVFALSDNVNPRDISDFLNGCSTWHLDIIDVTQGLFPFPTCPGIRVLPIDPNTGLPYNGERVHVAILDTGFVPNWSDYFAVEAIDTVLATSFLGGPPALSGGPEAPTDAMWDKDIEGHGTAVASIILGYRFTESTLYGAPRLLITNGVAPKAKIIPVRVLNNRSGSSIDIAQGIYYVANLSEKPMVINMSFGSLQPDPVEEAAINFAIAQGVVVVASAGNCGPDTMPEICPIGAGGMTWPAAYPQVISVGATGYENAFKLPGEPNPNGFFEVLDVPEDNGNLSYIAGFSSRERPGQELDVMAPGVEVFSPSISRGARATPCLLNNKGCLDEFGWFVGASASSAHVAGTAALLLQKNPNLTQAEVECALKSSAIPIDPAPGVYVDPLRLPTSHWGNCPEQNGICHEEQGLGAHPGERCPQLRRTGWSVVSSTGARSMQVNVFPTHVCVAKVGFVFEQRGECVNNKTILVTIHGTDRLDILAAFPVVMRGC
jgi:subtilisin family serine protease